MSSPTSEFWQALVRIGGDTADRLRWRTLAPTSAPAFHQAGLLREAGPADVVYRPGSDGREQCYRIVRHAESVVGVDIDDEESIIDIDGRDAVDWAVDWTAVRERLVQGLGLEAQDMEVRGLHACWKIGRLLLETDVPVAVFLAAPGSAAGLTRAIDLIAAGTDLPSVVLVPNVALLGGEIADRARNRSVSVVGMAQRIALRDRLLIGHPDRDAVFAELLGWLGLGFGQRLRFAFQAAGDGWDTVFDGASKRIRHLKGMLYLHLLLQQPKVGIHVTRLAAVVDGVDESVFKGGKGQQSAHEILKSLRDRLLEIATERDEASDFNDTAKVSLLDEEKRAVLRHVGAVAGLRGKERPTDDGEKARLAVRKNIKDAIAAIRAHLPAMADHLDEAMDYGFSITYAPKGTAPDWVM